VPNKIKVTKSEVTLFGGPLADDPVTHKIALSRTFTIDTIPGTLPDFVNLPFMSGEGMRTAKYLHAEWNFYFFVGFEGDCNVLKEKGHGKRR